MPPAVIAAYKYDIAPNLSALLFFLHMENTGAIIREEKAYFSEKHLREVYEMSNGLNDALTDDQHWSIIHE